MFPIIIFKNQQQAYDCLFYWAEILNLQSWIIDIKLDHDAPCIAPNWGSSSIWRAMHIAEISIPMPKRGQINPFPQKYCQEEIMIHELCHILLPGHEANTDTTEGDFYEKEQHARLETVAKALVMARYNLSIEWFYNF